MKTGREILELIREEVIQRGDLDWNKIENSFKNILNDEDLKCDFEYYSDLFDVIPYTADLEYGMYYYYLLYVCNEIQGLDSKKYFGLYEETKDEYKQQLSEIGLGFLDDCKIKERKLC